MFYYELKKITAKSSGKITLVLLTFLLIGVSIYSIYSESWVNAKGDTEKGIAAIHKIRKAQNQWEAPLTEARIAEVIQENARIKSTKEAKSSEIQQSNIAYGWTQGIQGIRDLINNSFCAFRDYDYYKADHLSAQDAALFYTNRINSLQNWLDGEAKDQYTKPEKAYFIQQFQAMQTPLSYAYMGGWETLSEFSPMILMIMTILLGFLLAPVFAGEFQLKADSILYASRYGRSRAITAKLQAVILFVSGIYWTIMLLYTAIILGIFGTSGANCMIQSNHSWKSFYNLTNREEYLLILFGGYLACLAISLLVLLISAWTQSTILAALTPVILLFLPSLLSNYIHHKWGTQLLALLPDQLFQINHLLLQYNIYTIAGSIHSPLPLLIGIYALLSILLPLITHSIYQNHCK